MMFEVILFDMDGVVIDTHQAVSTFWEKLARKHDVRLTPAIFDQYIYGSPAIYTLDHVFPQLSADERGSVIHSLVDYETNQTYTEVKGVTTLLRDLKRHGVPTALVTSGERWKVDEVMEQLGLAGLFTVEITANDIRQGKPHPECYLLAAQKLQKPPERCIVFEDSINGMKAGVASGALCIGVRPASMAAALLDAGARYVVADFVGVQVDGLQSSDSAPLNLRIGPEYSLHLASN